MRSATSRKTGWLVALILVCGFQFLFLPFYHFHPESTHSHSGELSPHHHIAHFHSHELEGLGASFLPTAQPVRDPMQREHDADDTEFDMAGSKVLPGSMKILMGPVVQLPVALPTVTWTRWNLSPPLYENPGPIFLLPPAERSPPARSI